MNMKEKNETISTNIWIAVVFAILITTTVRGLNNMELTYWVIIAYILYIILLFYFIYRKGNKDNEHYLNNLHVEIREEKTHE